MASGRSAAPEAPPTDARVVGPTRERILFEAAALFARRGYHATTTREIADAVGIRQPSLFHHFASKDAIVEALLEWDLGRALPAAHGIAALEESPAVRLFRYLLEDVRHLAEAPYNLSGVYAEEVIGRPQFAPWARRRAELHDAIEGMIRAGIQSGDFIDVDARLVRHIIAGILVRTLTVHSGGRAGNRQLANEVARLIVRGLLQDQRLLGSIEERARSSTIGRA